MSVADLYLVLLLGTTVLLVALGAVRLSTRAGLPSLLVYLGLGLLLGESGPGGLHFDDAALARVLGLTALAVILAEGGLTTRWQAVRPAVGLAAVLATLGVGVSVAVTALAARVVLGVDWRTAAVLGAVVSSTDAAAVFATLRRLRLPSRVVGALELESGINDAPAVLLVSLLSAPSFGDEPAWESLLLLAYELLAGGLVGVAAGVAGAWLLRHSALPAAGLYPLGVVGCTLFAFALAGVAHASGFLAVYLCALVLGNASLPHRQATLGFAEGLAWLAQIGLFVMLGLLAAPRRLSAELLPALAIGAVLLLLARPVSVAVSALPFRVPWREQVFLSWAGLRGAVPIVLATIPMTEGLAGGTRVFDLVFVLVVVFTLVQGTTLTPVARLLRVVRPGEARELPMDSAPLEDLHADLLQVRVPPGSRLHGTYLAELRLPPGAMVSLVVRDGASFVPDGSTRLRTDDDLLVVTTSASRVAAERRLRAVSRRGRLARWYGEDGREQPGR